MYDVIENNRHRSADLLAKAERCRRLAAGMLNQQDPVVQSLLALAKELETMAHVAREAEEREEG